MTIKTQDIAGDGLYGYVAQPETAGKGSVLIVPTIFGVNAFVRGYADILALHEKIGDFGTLLYCGKDWADPALSRRSMELMAEKVMPAVNAAIGNRVAAE